MLYPGFTWFLLKDVCSFYLKTSKYHSLDFEKKELFYWWLGASPVHLAGGRPTDVARATPLATRPLVPRPGGVHGSGMTCLGGWSRVLALENLSSWKIQKSPIENSRLPAGENLWFKTKQPIFWGQKSPSCLGWVQKLLWPTTILKLV